MKRRYKTVSRISLVGAVAAALVGASALAAGGARSDATSCVATLSFDTLTIRQDTDPNALDVWNVHVYAYVNEVQGKSNELTQGGFLKGDTGAVISIPNPVMLDHVVVGSASQDVSFLIKSRKEASRIAEKDPSNGKSGVPPSDRANFGVKDTIPACQPGTYHYAPQVQIPASPGGNPNETDGLAVPAFTLTLEQQ
jgi:hypothetical protein